MAKLEVGGKNDVHSPNRPLSMKENCKGLFGKLFGHKYEARGNSTSSAPTVKRIGEGYSDANEIIGILEASKSKTFDYLFDICVRCGNRIEK